MIRINSVIIKSLSNRNHFRPLLCVLLLLLPLLLAAAGDFQDFSKQTPGTFPEGWSYAWQRAVDDVIYVTNAGDPSHPEKRQFLLDRTTGDDHSYYRLSRSFQLKEMDGAAAVFAEFRFKIECESTSSAPFEVEYGVPRKKIVMLNFALRNWGPHVFLYPVCLPTWTDNWNAKVLLGDFQKNQWQRVRLLIPYGADSSLRRCYGQLYDSRGRGGKVFSTPVHHPMEERSAITIIPGNRKKGARLWFADFSLRPASEKEIRDFIESAK